MVDSTRGIGPISNVTPSERAQNSRKDTRAETLRSNDPVDEVEISQAALEVSEAERIAKNVGTELAGSGEVVSLSNSDFEGLV